MKPGLCDESLMRCCRDTLEWHGPKDPQDEARTVCRWCGDDLIYRQGRWVASRPRFPLDLPLDETKGNR